MLVLGNSEFYLLQAEYSLKAPKEICMGFHQALRFEDAWFLQLHTGSGVGGIGSGDQDFKLGQCY